MYYSHSKETVHFSIVEALTSSFFTLQHPQKNMLIQFPMFFCTSKSDNNSFRKVYALFLIFTIYTNMEGSINLKSAHFVTNLYLYIHLNVSICYTYTISESSIFVDICPFNTGQCFSVICLSYHSASVLTKIFKLHKNEPRNDLGNYSVTIPFVLKFIASIIIHKKILKTIFLILSKNCQKNRSLKRIHF